MSNQITERPLGVLNRWLEVLLPVRSRVLGVTLKPLCAGHLWLLSLIESPFILQSDAASKLDLCAAVVICSLSFEDGSSELEDLTAFKKTIEEFFSQAEKKLSPTWEKEAVIFRRYLRDSLSNQPVLKSPVTPRDSEIQSDWTMLIVVSAMSELHMSWSDAVNFPLLRLRWLSAIHAEREGGVELVDSVGFEQQKEEADKIYQEGVARFGRAE